MRVLVIGGISHSLINFRGRMLQAMLHAGHEVHACAGEVERRAAEALTGMGVRFHPVDLQRRGTSVVGDWQYYHAVRRVIGEVRPELVLSYTIKPVIYGSLAAHRLGVKKIAAMITGAGAAAPGPGLKERAVAAVARRLYRRALRHAEAVFFQNPDDEAMFRHYGLLGRGRVVQVPGSGVDLEYFTCAPPVTEPMTFVLIARLLMNKGIREFVEAARQLHSRHRGIKCLLVGPEEQGSGGIARAEVDRWQSQGLIEYVGSLDDVRPYLEQASVYVLPSYREGTPRTVLEAMATGRPVITTDAPGCRETVEEGVNGFLVPPGDWRGLADAMERFIVDRGLIETMGAASRRIAEEKYDVHRVNRLILEALCLSG